MRRYLYTLVVGCWLLGPSAAAGQMATAVQPVDPYYGVVDTEAPRSDAAITPLDHLQITVFREPDLSVADALVDEAGNVALPLVGTIRAAGKSTDVLSSEIEGKLVKYLKNPEVAVSVTQAASRRITVAGSVVQPGVYPLEGRLTLLQAVALARGPTRVASLDQALVFRTKNGQRTVARFDLDQISRGHTPDPEVISGDTVAIGSSKFKTAWRDIVDTVSSFNIFRIIP
jgi:polysaccharide export outer membrane protein